MTIAPPSTPAALGSKLYPWEDIRFGDRQTVPEQMKTKSILRLRMEEERYLANKAPNYESFRQINGRTPRYCKICSESFSYVHDALTTISHTHVSSMRNRINAKTDIWGQYRCDSCSEEHHSAFSGVRYPILATSSTMNEWQGKLHDRSKGNKFHIETIGIPGAKVQDIHHAFMAEYGNSEIPVDLILIAGFNNLLDGQTAELVLDEMEHFKEDVLNIPDSTFAACSLPLPPKISWLPEDNYENNLRDLTDDIIELNYSIKELNNSPGQKDSVRWCPQFHTWGLRSARGPRQVGPRRLLEALPAHQQNDWRESRPRNQLHLNQKVRGRMGKAIENYFRHIYEVKD